MEYLETHLSSLNYTWLQMRWFSHTVAENPPMYAGTCVTLCMRQHSFHNGSKLRSLGPSFLFIVFGLKGTLDPKYYLRLFLGLKFWFFSCYKSFYVWYPECIYQEVHISSLRALERDSFSFCKSKEIYSDLLGADSNGIRTPTSWHDLHVKRES